MERVFRDEERSEGDDVEDGRGTGLQRNPVRRAFEVLRRMLDGPQQEWGVRTLAAALGLPVTSVHRVLRTLEAEGIVEQVGTSGAYRVGLELYRLAWRATSSNPVAKAALPVLQDLAAACNETALLGLYEASRKEMVFAASAESRHPVRYVVELNQWVPLHAGASGLAILAFLPDDERAQIVQRGLGAGPITPATITDPFTLDKELRRVRSQGYACTTGQRIAGAVGLAAPIFGSDGRVVGDVMVTIPTHRFDPANEGELAATVMEHAAEITRRLGGAVPAVAGPPET